MCFTVCPSASLQQSVVTETPAVQKPAAKVLLSPSAHAHTHPVNAEASRPCEELPHKGTGVWVRQEDRFRDGWGPSSANKPCNVRILGIIITTEYSWVRT